ncbi:MerR family transcriptional regulator [Enterococcus faecalis]|nr:MerR family transcriptional regulator [Enterococcus faecalis]
MYTIKEFSALSELEISTLRYYEKLGILVPKRNKNNYRVYFQEDLTWIQFILRLKQIGMSLKNIQEYSSLRSKGDHTIKERIDLLNKQEKILVNKITELEENLLFLQKKQKIYSNLLSNF